MIRKWFKYRTNSCIQCESKSQLLIDERWILSTNKWMTVDWVKWYFFWQVLTTLCEPNTTRLSLCLYWLVYVCVFVCISLSKSCYKSSRSLAHIQWTMCKPKFSIKWTKRSVVFVWLCAVETDQYMYTSTDTDDRVILSVPVLIHTDCVIIENTWKKFF